MAEGNYTAGVGVFDPGRGAPIRDKVVADQINDRIDTLAQRVSELVERLRMAITPLVGTDAVPGNVNSAGDGNKLSGLPSSTHERITALDVQVAKMAEQVARLEG